MVPKCLQEEISRGSRMQHAPSLRVFRRILNLLPQLRNTRLGLGRAAKNSLYLVLTLELRERLVELILREPVCLGGYD